MDPDSPCGCRGLNPRQAKQSRSISGQPQQLKQPQRPGPRMPAKAASTASGGARPDGIAAAAWARWLRRGTDLRPPARRSRPRRTGKRHPALLERHAGWLPNCPARCCAGKNAGGAAGSGRWPRVCPSPIREPTRPPHAACAGGCARPPGPTEPARCRVKQRPPSRALPSRDICSMPSAPSSKAKARGNSARPLSGRRPAAPPPASGARLLTLERRTPRSPAPGPQAPQALQALLRDAARPPVVGCTAPARDAATPVSSAVAVATDSGIDRQVRRWMPVAVPMTAVLLCAGIALIWVLA